MSNKQLSEFGLVDFLYNGVTYPDVKIIKVEQEGKKPYYTTIAVPDAGLGPDKVRLYLWNGMPHDFENVVKPFFEGDIVEIENMPSKKGSPYTGRFVLDPTVESEFKDREGNPYFYGKIEFAPRESETEDAFASFF